ncbi:MAG: hypothetical protein IJB59_08305 [Oscillospiraceae bacterium]|nr:hypothetical protein [Oscillospiraceae bacterium]
MAFAYEGDIIFGILTALAASLPSMAFGMASYVLSALAIYVIARRRGLHNPWLAWVPVVNVWLLGSLSDQYRYVVRGEIRSRRKWLLMLSVLMSALTTAVLAMAVSMIAAVGSGLHGFHGDMVNRMIGSVLSLLGLVLPLLGTVIAYLVIRFMALYDVYKSLDPDNAVLFLVLSICFGVTEPFFLFFNRNKDKGMPPRKQEPVYTQEEPQWQPPEPEKPFWETDSEKDYL